MIDPFIACGVAAVVSVLLALAAYTRTLAFYPRRTLWDGLWVAFAALGWIFVILMTMLNPGRTP